MDRDHRRSKKRPSGGKGVLSLVLSFSLFSGAIAANLPLYFGSPLRDSPFIPPQIPLDGSPSEDTHEFSLRHIFHRGTHEYPDLHQRLDVEPDTRLMSVSEDGQTIKLAGLDTKLTASSNPITIQRLADRRPSVIEGYLQAARHTGEMTALSPEAWVMDTVQGPNVKSKPSVLTFAMMTANDYVEVPGTGKWHDLNRGRFNYSSSFGWHSDGLRGHIYADKTNSTVVISLKGTSPALFDGAGTTTNDKVNDNLFFSCCCGEGGSYLWRESCECMQSTYTANLTCIIEAMNDENRYYRASMDLYSNVTELYPNANVWLTGHSLGGAMSSLLGLTYGLPVVSFEAIPDALPASRLGLPSPPGDDPRFPQKRKFTGAYHFGHTADPIYTGTCNGIGSTCTWGGYALETACHTGFMCAYDTVTDLGWRSGIGTHRIESVITDVLKAYDTVPPCVPEEECYDCELWKFFRSNGSETTTTSSTSSATSTTWSSATRTSTCQTPGWWGCLDETTTTTGTTTSEPTTTSATTSTCKTPGWFGCYDSTTTTTTATPAPTLTTTIPTETSTTTTCKDPGWFGCRDPTTTPGPSVSSPPVTATATATDPATATSTTCKSPGLFWGCWDSSTTANANGYLITPAPAPPAFTATA